MANSSYLNYSNEQRIFLIQPLTAETCQFFAETILKNHFEDFYNQANISKFECIGNSFFCSSYRDLEHISSCLNIFSKVELNFIIQDMTENLNSSKFTKIQLGKSVKRSRGVMNLITEFAKDFLILEDATELKSINEKEKSREKLKLKLKLKLAVKSEQFEMAAQIRDELLKFELL